MGTGLYWKGQDGTQKHRKSSAHRAGKALLLSVLFGIIVGVSACSGLTSASNNTSPPPPQTNLTISNIAASGATASSVTISWTTSAGGTSQVEYGLTTSYGQSSPLVSTLATGHSVTLSGLTASTTYHYRVKSQDSTGQLVVSGDQTFMTLATQQSSLTISNIAASGATASSVTISWTTSAGGTSQVDYGLTTSYGQSSPFVSTLATSHSVTLSGLTASTTYHYRVKSQDSTGQLVVSGDQTFTTQAAPQAGLTISNVSVGNLSTSSATVSWTTSAPASTQVRYGTTSSYNQSSALVSTLTTSHSVTLSGLNPSTLYHFSAESRDAGGNVASSSDQTFQTNAAPVTGGTTTRFNFSYADRNAFLADGWSFVAKTAAGGARNTEQTGTLAVSYDQTAHPGTIQIPLGAGEMWETANNSQNTIFRSLPSDWISLRLMVKAFAPTSNYQQVGLIAYQDDDNYVDLNRLFSDAPSIEIFREQTGAAVKSQVGSLTANTNLILRLDRDPASNTYNGFYSTDNGNTWVPAGSTTVSLAGPGLAVQTGNDLSGTTPTAQLAWVEIVEPGPPGPLQVTGGKLPDATMNVSYSTALSASGGTAPYTWSLISGALPAGLALQASNGTISGKPTQAGGFSFAAQAKDSGGQTASGSFTLSVVVDSTAPTISNVQASPSSNGAIVTWTTNEISDSQVDYGATSAYGQSSTLNTSLVTLHSVSLTGLTATTTYHFRVKSRDAAGNLATGGDLTFTTTAVSPGPQIAANTWVLLNPASDPSAIADKGNCGGVPCPRSWAPMVYDSDARKMLVLGGGVGGGCLNVGGGYVNDVWQFDFSTNAWKQRLGVDANRAWPPGADNVSAAYDPVQKRSWMQGGTCGLGFGYYDYAANAGVSKRGLPGEHGAPTGGVQDPGMAFSPDNNKLIFFGGEPAWQYDPGFKTDQFDPTTNAWTDRQPATNPPGRQQTEYAMAYSPLTKKFIVFGGEDFGGRPDFDDTWEYDYATNTWTKPAAANAPNVHPGGRSRHAMVWDSGQNVVILHGGSCNSGPCNDTWAYDPVKHQWAQVATGPARRLHGLVYDSANDVVLLFGGTDNPNGNNSPGLYAFRYQPSGSAPPPPPPPATDTTPPSVSVTAPAAGATVSGTVSVTASASDNVGVAGVQFKLDGANLGAEDSASPYSVSWDTTSAANGTHTITAVARDAAGNTATSAAVSVTVGNSAPPPPPSGTQITSFTLTSGITGTLPFTVGLGFKKGDIPGVPVLDVTSSQVIVKARWSDGSVKHAIASGEMSLTAGVPATVHVLSAASAPVGTSLTAADIQAANPSASVRLGAIGTVNLSSLLAAPFRTWISGPQMVEAHYRSSVGTDPTLQVWFHVRLYKSGRIWVRTVVQNGYLDVTTADKSYVPTVTIGTANVFTNGGISLTNYAHTAWTADGWIGGDPQVTPRLDTAYLEASGLVPNYMNQTPSAGTLNGLYQQYVPMQNGSWDVDMGSTGFQNQIGLLPNWDALFVTSGGDARAWKAVQSNAKALESYPVVWNDSATRLPVRPTDRPTWTVDGNNAGGETSIFAGPLHWDVAHHGSGGYLAYLITGDYSYLNIMEEQASLCYLMNSSTHGSGTNRDITGIVQDRGQAWCLRTLSQLAAIAPSTDSIASDYRTLLANGVATLNSVAQNPATSQIGYVLNWDVNGNFPYTILSPWQQHFLMQSLGMGSDIEPLSNMATWNALRDFSYKGIVGILGPTGTSNYCFTDAGPYEISITDIAHGTPSQYYPDWGVVWSKNHGGAQNTSCGNTLQGSSGGDPLNAATGYWGNLMPAIAYAVDDAAPGAAQAWARLTGATNWGSVLSSGFGDTPIWGVVPRSSTPAAAAVTVKSATTAMAAIAPPTLAISGVSSAPNADSAAVNWTTSVPADTLVEYGTTTSYGTATTLDPNLTTKHSVLLTGLTPSTFYHYRVKSRDASGNLASSGDFSFTTMAATATPASVQLTVQEPVGSARIAEPVTTGVPFPNGNAGNLTLCDAAGNEIPSQIQRLSGKAPWFLLDFQTDLTPGATKIFTLKAEPPTVQPAAQITKSETATTVTVNTGPLEVMFRKDRFNMFEQVRLNGTVVSASNGRNIWITDASGATFFGDTSAPTRFVAEVDGPIRTTYRIDGDFTGWPGMGYTIRLTFFAGKSTVAVEYVIRNSLQSNERHAHLNDAAVQFGGGAAVIRATRSGSISAAGYPSAGVEFSLVAPSDLANNGFVLPDLSYRGATAYVDFANPDSAETIRQLNAAKSPLMAIAPASWYSAYGGLSTTDFATGKAGLTWSASQVPNDPPAPDYWVGWGTANVQSSIESDDLWQNLLKFLQTGGKEYGYFDRARAWARYYKWEYSPRTDSFAYNRDSSLEDPNTPLNRSDLSTGLTTADVAYLRSNAGKIGASSMNQAFGFGLADWYLLTGDVGAVESLADIKEVVNLLASRSSRVIQ